MVSPVVVRFTAAFASGSDALVEAFVNLAVWAVADENGEELRLAILRVEDEPVGPYYKLVVHPPAHSLGLGLERAIRQRLGELATLPAEALRSRFASAIEAGRSPAHVEVGLELHEDWQPRLMGEWDLRGFRTSDLRTD
jgi:hypothetical protein